MFATLIGTDTGDVTHRALFDELHAIATRRGYAPPDTALRVQPDGSLDGWSLEHMGPPDRAAEFLLAVTAPRVPGTSPVFPCAMPSPGHCSRLWSLIRCLLYGGMTDAAFRRSRTLHPSRRSLSRLLTGSREQHEPRTKVARNIGAALQRQQTALSAAKEAWAQTTGVMRPCRASGVVGACSVSFRLSPASI